MKGKLNLKCSKCGKEILVNTSPSENWKYYCPKCGMEEALKEIKASNGYYDFGVTKLERLFYFLLEKQMRDTTSHKKGIENKKEG